LPLARVARLAGESARGRLAVAAPAAVGAAALCAAGLISWRTYFGRQLSDPQVFAEFSSADTRIAEVAATEGANASLYVPTWLLDTPTELFLLGRPLGARTFERTHDVPLPDEG